MRWSLRMQDSGEVLFFNNGNSLESAATLEIGAWNHVAAVFDGTGAESVAKVYVNGEPSGELVGFTLNPGADTTVRIGHSDAAINQTWLGALDDIRVYNYAVDVLQIAGQYYSVTGDTPCIYPIDASYDVNQDCVVDLLDLASFGAGWLTTGLYPDCCP